MFTYSENLQKDLILLANIMSTSWIKQNNFKDRQTDFIYEVFSLEDLNKKIIENKLSNFDKNYAQHRWFNYAISSVYESLFDELGAVKVSEEKDRLKDFYINDLPFDLKVTVYPSKFEKGLDLTKPENSEKLIKWLYENQSKQRRFHKKNRLFIVCLGDSVTERNIAKASFLNNKEIIKDYLDNFVPREIVLNDGTIVFSDIILVGGN